MLKDLLYAPEDKEEGFSLVELLVVIVIIGILSAIAIMAFMNQRQKANDASLQSDMRTVANSYTAFTVDRGADDMKEIMGSSRSTYIYGDDLEKPENNAYWNDHEELPRINIGDNAIVEIVVIDEADETTWTRAFDEGEFCLTGRSTNSSWDYGMPGGVSGHSNYDKILFYDAKLGGINTMDELVEAYQNGREFSCSGHASRYMKATIATETE